MGERHVPGDGIGHDSAANLAAGCSLLQRHLDGRGRAGTARSQCRQSYSDSLRSSRLELFAGYSGYEQTPMLFSQLLDQMLRLQAISRLFRSYLTAQIAGPDTVEHVDPLMKTILHISATTS